MTGGRLRWSPIAASMLITDLGAVLQVRGARIYFRALEIEPTESSTGKKRGTAGNIIVCLEQFRRYGVAMLTEEWETGLPAVPLTKEEVGYLLKQTLERDEGIVVEQLALNGSVSADIRTRLGKTKPLLKEAFTQLQGGRLTQETLATIITGARFKYAPKEEYGLVSVWRPRKCGHVDSYKHLLKCHGLKDGEASGSRGGGISGAHGPQSQDDRNVGTYTQRIDGPAQANMVGKKDE